MKRYVKGRCDMCAFQKQNGMTREKVLVSIKALFTVHRNQEFIALDAARKVLVYMTDMHGNPAELGRLTACELAQEIAAFFPDCVECEVAFLGQHVDSWIGVSSVVRRHPKWRWLHAWR